MLRSDDFSAAKLQIWEVHNYVEEPLQGYVTDGNRKVSEHAK
jgi:hypothetical protein